MKWDKPNPPVQYSADRRYCIVQANGQYWVSYRMGPTAGEEIGTSGTDERARKICDDHADRESERA